MVESIVREKEVGANKAKYPYIGTTSTGCVVLFSGNGKGTVLGGPIWGIGHYSNNWAEGNFRVLEQDITLRNKE